MSPPVRPEFDPAQIDAAVKALKAQGAPDEAIHAYLQQTVGLKPVAQGHDYHAEYKSGALQKRMEGANARDMANAKEETEPVGPVAAFGHSLAATGANIAQGIPGMEAVQAGIRASGPPPEAVAAMAQHPLPSSGADRPQPYGEALADIRAQTGKIPAGLKTIERIAGSMPLSKFLPASPVTSGAILGGADQLLSADPGQSAGGRALRTAVGAAGGAAVGKTGEQAVTGLRTLVAPSAARNVFARKAAQAASAKALYGAALREGQGKAPTPAVQQFLQEPDIAEIVSELQQTRPFQGVQAHEPAMLDAIYKTLSDRAAQLKKGLESIAPNRPNIGRFRMQDTKAAQSKLLEAIETPGQATHTTETAQSPHPDLRDAIDAFHQSKGIAAGRREGTVMQQKAREMLERRSAESHVTPPITGSRTQTIETPPLMPSYRDAVQDFARHGQGVEGVQRGYDAIRTRLGKNLPRSANLTRTTPEALEEWAHAADDASKSAAGEGVLGGVRSATGLGVRAGFKALRKAPGVMRDANVPAQRLSDLLVKLGLVGANAALQE